MLKIAQHTLVSSYVTLSRAHFSLSSCSHWPDLLLDIKRVWKLEPAYQNVWVDSWIHIMSHHARGHASKRQEVSHRFWLPKSWRLCSHQWSHRCPPPHSKHHLWTERNKQYLKLLINILIRQWMKCLMWTMLLVVTNPHWIITDSPELSGSVLQLIVLFVWPAACFGSLSLLS